MPPVAVAESAIPSVRRPVGGDCGLAYVSRQYQLLPGASPGPVNSVIGFAAPRVGYEGFVFVHDNGVISALLTRATNDRELAGLRVTPAFDAAMRAIPGLDVWTEPGRTLPITGVLPGARLHNSFRGQLTEAGRVGLPGLFFVGDAVCTTNPTFGRGIATSLMQAQQLLRLLDEHGEDFPSCSGRVRRLVHGVHQAVVRRSCRDRRAPGPPMGGPRHRPERTTTFRLDHGGCEG